MTGTSVKDVGLTLGSMAASRNVSAKDLSRNGFRKVWDNQSGRENFGEPANEAQTVIRKTPGESLKAKEEHRLRTAKPEEIEESPEEMSGIKPEEAMMVLQTAATELTEKIADAFGMSSEEVQTAMEELDMGSLDVLNPGKLGELLLKVSGAEDTYALVTNEALYDSYRDLMGQLQSLVQEAGRELNLDEDQIAGLLEKMWEQPDKLMTGEETMPEIRAEDVRSDSEKAVEKTDEMQPVTEKTVAGEEESKKTETGSESGSEERQQPSSDKGETSNLFLQNLKTEQFQPQNGQEVQNTSAWSPDTQDIMRQIMDYMKVQVKSDMSNLEMQLHPQNLGTLQIHVASKGGVVTANFITQNEAVKSALESQMVQLQQNFEEQGIKVNAIEVTVQTHEFERNLDQGRGNNNQNQEPTKRNRIRRINLSDVSVPEEMEQEDALAAEMMAADGNTVDYTA